MKPVEKSRAKLSCSLTGPKVAAIDTRCWLMPSLPTAVRRRSSMFSGGAVMMLITPPTASEPYSVEPEPRSTSTRVDGIERHRDIHIVVAGLRVAQALAVEQHQRLGEGAAAYRKVGLHAIGRAFLKIERRVGAQQVDQRVEHQAVGAPGSSVMARSISSSESGSKVPVTTTVSCRAAGARLAGGCGAEGCWATTGKARRNSERNEKRNSLLYPARGEHLHWWGML
jgi:hypothetical protein